MKNALTFLGGILLLFAVQSALAAEGYTSAECGDCHPEPAEDNAASAHAQVACLSCHPGAAAYDHEERPGELRTADCRTCHPPHDEKTAHDAHVRVSCLACHAENGVPERIPRTGRIRFSGETRPGTPYQPHHRDMNRNNRICGKCHYRNNPFGAAAAHLPTKSVLCMPCHAATLSVSDATTAVSLTVFLLGMLGTALFWFRGAKEETRETAAGKRRGFDLAAAAGALFLKRLYRRSRVRWGIHALIFYPIFIRFLLGLLILILSLTVPEWSVTRALIDKNHPFRAIFFDFTGLCILAGVISAWVRRGEADDIGDLPEAAGARGGMTALLGLVIAAGFLVEGGRIVTTGFPPGAAYAFFGYGIALLFTGGESPAGAYELFWYTHAVLTGIFIALIPFTRMLHIFTAPIWLYQTHLAESTKELTENHQYGGP
jgi:nitrate reductase gamma subunit